LPPLRERRDDISVLAQHFLQCFAAKTHREVEGFNAEALDILCAYDWPGNARELSNVVEMALILTDNPIVGAHTLPVGMASGRDAPLSRLAGKSGSEKDALVKALESCGGNKSLAAKKLNWSRMTLYRKMQRHQLAPLPGTVTSHVTS
jgi:DNA-binding NtrC family response regulator